MRLDSYVFETRSIPKLYFAHPRATYDREMESNALKLIKRTFPSHIIVNPNVPWAQGKVTTMGFDIFYKIVNTVEFVVCLPIEDKTLTWGVWRECRYADKMGKDIYMVDLKRNKLTKKEFTYFDHLSAEDTYARISPEDQKKYSVYESEEIEIMEMDRIFDKYINEASKKFATPADDAARMKRLNVFSLGELDIEKRKMLDVTMPECCGSCTSYRSRGANHVCENINVRKKLKASLVVTEPALLCKYYT